MTSHADQIEDFALPLPIPQAARAIAETFANQQPTPQKAEQVRLNTLAVWVVNEYLHMMEIATDVGSSDSWNAVVRLCADVADLNVVGVGRLECRPIQVDRQSGRLPKTCPIPPESWGDRVGYVIVRLDTQHQDVAVLGFTTPEEIEDVPLTQLRPPEDLINYLQELR